jgi:triacylglycerol lipase
MSPINIVLVHGILGFRRKFGIEYFNGVKELLTKFTPNILVPVLDPAGSIILRGERLRTLILGALGDGTLDPAQRTHVIAHSQGGLDARYMLSPKNPHLTPRNSLAGKIASLTTIGSPHQGSQIADLLMLKPVDRAVGSLELLIHHPELGQDFVEAMLDRLGIEPEALADLGTESMKQFNASYPDEPRVRYFSIAGKGRAGVPETSLFLYEFHHHIKAVTGEENDGLVAVSSAQHWPTDGQEWPADHAEEIGHDLNRPDLAPVSGFDYLGAYEAIVNRVKGL